RDSRGEHSCRRVWLSIFPACHRHQLIRSHAWDRLGGLTHQLKQALTAGLALLVPRFADTHAVADELELHFTVRMQSQLLPHLDWNRDLSFDGHPHGNTSRSITLP